MILTRFILLIAWPILSSGGSGDFLVRSVDGRESRGKFISWSIPGRMEIGTDLQPLFIESDEIDLVSTPAPQRPTAGRWTIRMLDGTRLTGQVADGDGEKISFRNSLVGDLTLPLNGVHSISLAGSAEQKSMRTASNAGQEDLILLQNGDVLTGGVSAIAEQGVRLGNDQQERLLSWDQVRSVQLVNETVEDTLRVRLRLVDGGLLCGSAMEWKGARLVIEYGDHQRAQISESAVASVEPIGGRRVWLSELPVHTSVDVPYFDRTWPMRIDSNSIGGPLLLSGVRYQRGLGLHSAGRWTWQLGGQYVQLRAIAGIDDSAGGLADADLSISLDGRKLFEARSLKPRASLERIDLDITGGRELTIEVGFGRNGPVQDRVNLVDAVLIRGR